MKKHVMGIIIATALAATFGVTSVATAVADSVDTPGQRRFCKDAPDKKQETDASDLVVGIVHCKSYDAGFAAGQDAAVAGKGTDEKVMGEKLNEAKVKFGTDFDPGDWALGWGDGGKPATS
ncbi:hypothetical protein ABZY03_33985 [Streptomyces klenkii]|uniref:hypothetical protein n=1 Tax=Streptomyces klenkii TaxID=1420899 RepID=UPI0033B581E9